MLIYYLVCYFVYIHVHLKKDTLCGEKPGGLGR